ncbi:MAG: hypothetical protein ACRCYQ_06795 [Nocardioides sp.]
MSVAASLLEAESLEALHEVQSHEAQSHEMQSPETQSPETQSREVTVARLRERVRRVHGGAVGVGHDRPGVPLATDSGLAGLLQLRAGGCYGVANASLALAMMSGPSRAGAWTAVVGVPDLGVEAAVEFGIALDRTIVVPHPEDSWAEVTAALIGITDLVVIRPPPRVGVVLAGRLRARLRTHSTALVVWGEWPRCDARLSIAKSRWVGLGEGHGHLRERRIEVEVRRGAAPPRRAEICWPRSGRTALDPAGPDRIEAG